MKLQGSCFSVSLLISLLLLSICPSSAEQSLPRLITAYGQGEVKVIPDKAILILSVRTWDKVLQNAVRQNDTATKKVLSLGGKYKIEPKRIQTSDLTINPTYVEHNDYVYSSKATGYKVEKDIAFEVKPTILQQLISDIIEAGGNRINGIEFGTTELRKYRDQARLLAVRAAREKAIAMATELGQKVGRPWKIDEGGGWSSPMNRTNELQGATNATMAQSEDGIESQGSVSLGTISIQAQVTVSFELE